MCLNKNFNKRICLKLSINVFSLAQGRFSMTLISIRATSTIFLDLALVIEGKSRAQRVAASVQREKKMTRAFGHASDSFFFPPGEPLLAIALTWQPTLLSLRARILFTRRNIGPREILASRKIFFRVANARERRKNTAPGLTPRYINASGVRFSSLLCVWNRYAHVDLR